MITDLELIKQVAIKDFDHFTDHLGIVDEELDPLFFNNLFALGGVLSSYFLPSYLNLKAFLQIVTLEFN